MITRYYIKPVLGTEVREVKKLELDLAYALGVSDVKIDIDAVRGVITMDTVNIEYSKLLLGDCMKDLLESNARIPIIIGKDLNGTVYIDDLVEISNLLVAGTTGTGKSTMLNTIILEILYNFKPEDVKIVLIDTRIINFKRFANIPNLLIPPIYDTKKAEATLAWILQECAVRNKKFAENNVKNIEEYNEKSELKLPRIAVFIEDLCDLMSYDEKNIEEMIINIIQISRKVGIHLIISTYRTSTDIITGRIKANIPARLTFKLPSIADSRTVLNRGGAEQLLLYGDALFTKIGITKIMRLQAPYVSDEEIDNIVKTFEGKNIYNENDMKFIQDFEIDKGNNELFEEKSDDGYDLDPLLYEVADEVIKTGQASTSFIQRRFKIGYARAGRIMDQLEERGIISGYNGSLTRNVLMNMETYNTLMKEKEKNKNIRGKIVMEEAQTKTKFCKFCGEKIPGDAVMCVHCGRQVEQLKSEQPQVIINNTNNNTNTNINGGGVYRNEKNKWVALLLCIFLGGIGAHKFYEGKIGLGIVYLFTFGFLGIGWAIDFIVLLFKPNPYYV